MIDKTISHYRITGKLGEGGMGVVYKAFDTKPERDDVTLKVLRPEVMVNPGAEERFNRKQKSLPNYVKMIDKTTIGEEKE